MFNEIFLCYHYLAGAVTILSDLAGQDVSEGGEGVVHGLVVDGLVQVFDKDVADTRPTEGGVTLRPHDTNGAPLEDVEVHGIKCSLSCK